MVYMGHNHPLQATRWSGHLAFNRQAQRAPERERQCLTHWRGRMPTPHNLDVNALEPTVVGYQI